MANKAKLIREAAAKIRNGISEGSLHGTPIAHLKEHVGSGKLTVDHLVKAIAKESNVQLQMFRTVPHQPEIEKVAKKLHGELVGDPALQNLYHPKNFQTVGVKRGHITEDLDLINNKPTLIQRLRGETEATIAARNQAKAEFAEAKAELQEGFGLQKVELENKVALEQAEKKLRQKYGLEKKPMGTAKKIAYGGGAVAGGVLGYNALTGGAANNAGAFAEAENAGAQAAMRDAMAEGYGPVQMMAGPMPQISAANLNYDGRMMDARALGIA